MVFPLERLQIENFVVHPEGRGSARTDADLLTVRFPHRAERLFDNPNDIMEDDERGLSFSREMIDVVIAEVKTNQPCTLNGPWTQQDKQNVHRVLAAIGCLLREAIVAAADEIYRAGIHQSDLGLRIRLVAVGRACNQDLAARYPEVIQLTWPDLLAFIWERYHTYRQQKTQVDQWDEQGRKLKRLADESGDKGVFTKSALRQMGVRDGNPAG